MLEQFMQLFWRNLKQVFQGMTVVVIIFSVVIGASIGLTYLVLNGLWWVALPVVLLGASMILTVMQMVEERQHHQESKQSGPHPHRGGWR